MAGNSGAAGRSVTSRVVALLDAFTPERPELTLSELCRRTGLPAATAHRLAAELTSWGGLERTTAGGYRIGLRLWEVASLAPRGLLLRESAMPFLEDLYEATHEHVQLAVLDGLEAVCVEKISGRQAVRIRTRVGGRLPLHASGVGQVLLAYGPDDLLDRVLAQGLVAYTPRTIGTAHRLRQVLADIRRTGMSTTRGELTPGAASAAVPVLAPDRSVVAALSLVLTDGGRTTALGPALRAAALGISRTLALPSSGRHGSGTPGRTEWSADRTERQAL